MCETNQHWTHLEVRADHGQAGQGQVRQQQGQLAAVLQQVVDLEVGVLAEQRGPGQTDVDGWWERRKAADRCGWWERRKAEDRCGCVVRGRDERQQTDVGGGRDERQTDVCGGRDSGWERQRCMHVCAHVMRPAGDMKQAVRLEAGALPEQSEGAEVVGLWETEVMHLSRAESGEACMQLLMHRYKRYQPCMHLPFLPSSF